MKNQYPTFSMDPVRGADLIQRHKEGLTRHRRFLVVASQSGFMPTRTTMPPTGIGGRNHAKITTYHCTKFVISNSFITDTAKTFVLLPDRRGILAWFCWYQTWLYTGVLPVLLIFYQQMSEDRLVSRCLSLGHNLSFGTMIFSWQILLYTLCRHIG